MSNEIPEGFKEAHEAIAEKAFLAVLEPCIDQLADAFKKQENVSLVGSSIQRGLACAIAAIQAIYDDTPEAQLALAFAVLSSLKMQKEKRPIAKIAVLALLKSKGVTMEMIEEASS